MKLKPFFIAKISVVVIGTLVGVVMFLQSPPNRASAHNFVKFLISPYYGAGPWSRRWIPSSNPEVRHDGIDFLLRWDRILATADGNVQTAEWDFLNCHDDSMCPTDPNQGGFGLFVRIRHDINGEANYSYYGHLSVARPIGNVFAGEWIGTSGDSGNSSGPHLHFEVTHGCATIGNPTYVSGGCSVSPDNAGGTGTSLWKNGEWSGNDPTQSKAVKRYATLGTYGTEVSIDDDDDNLNNPSGFRRGRNGNIVCTSDADCPFWFYVTGAGNSNDYQWTNDSDNNDDYWAQWRPSLPSNGNYEVQVWMPCGPNNNNNSNFTAWSAYYYVGNFGPLKVDQLTLSKYDSTEFRRGCNRWIGLGIYDLAAGTGSSVKIVDETDSTGANVLRRVGVDAVKFVRVNIGGIEAEKPFKKTKKSDSSGNEHEWLESNTIPNAVGTYMSARPQTGSNVNSPNIEDHAPGLKFNVIFPTAGTYYVWVRGYATNTADDSIHAGFGQVETSADKMYCPQWSLSTWYWCNSTVDGLPATLSVANPGFQAIGLWMREDAFSVDRLILTKDAGYNPNVTPTNDDPYIFPGDDTAPED